MKSYFTFFIMLATTLVQIGITQDNYYEVQLQIPSIQPFDYFGTDVGISGNNAAVFGRDSVFFYYTEGENWINSRSWSSNLYSHSTSKHIHLNDDLCIIGCDLDGNGSFFLLEKTDQNWVEQFSYICMENGVHNFGMNVFLSDSLVLAKAVYDFFPNARGKVYIFRKQDNTWNLEASFLSPNSSNGDKFGSGLFIDGERAFIGAEIQSIPEVGDSIGAVYEFSYLEGEWNLENTILSPNPIHMGRFGCDLSFSDGILYVGESHQWSEYDTGGKVNIFQKNNGVWQHIHSIIPDDNQQNDLFGERIDVNGNLGVISARGKSDAGTGSGAVYIFQKLSNNDTSFWPITKKILPSDLTMGDTFGSQVSITDSYVICGAPWKDNFSGAVYIFDPNDTSLHANFVGTPLTGSLMVETQFTDATQGDPVEWSWDFDSDGVVDSQEQHPSWTFEFSGYHNITLSVSDGQAISSQVKHDYVYVADGSYLFGDMNFDGFLDIIDIVLLVDIVLGFESPSDLQLQAGDVNNSGSIDIIDIVTFVNTILEL